MWEGNKLPGITLSWARWAAKGRAEMEVQGEPANRKDERREDWGVAVY